MPTEWLLKLYNELLEANSEGIKALIQTIPDSEILLRQGLTKLVQEFEFEEIINLLEPLINGN